MRYLLGAHRINSNNVLTLKPCMTPEPLFDEGFVRSTAAVFTAIVVQIYKYSQYSIVYSKTRYKLYTLFYNNSKL